MIVLAVYLWICGNSASNIVVILVPWCLLLAAGMGMAYRKRRQQMKRLLAQAEQLPERYLISEVIDLPEQAEDQVYYRLLKMAGKSMLERDRRSPAGTNGI